MIRIDTTFRGSLECMYQLLKLPYSFPLFINLPPDFATESGERAHEVRNNFYKYAAFV